MEAIILAGGLGKRLSSVITDLPKPMAPVEKYPFLEILLNYLSSNGFKKIILAVGYQYEKIQNYFGFYYKNINLEYSIEKIPLGTGGAIKFAMNKVTSDHVYILNGDTFIDLDFFKIEKKWKNEKKPIIISCEVDDTSRYGVISFNKNLATGFSEKKKEGRGFINAGCFVLNINQLNNFFSGQVFSFENDYLVNAIKNKFFNVYLHKGIFIDIGIPEDYLKAKKILKKYID